MDVISRVIFSGINVILMVKKVGSIVFVVRIGCYVGNFCCLNFVFVKLDYLDMKNIKELLYIII